MNPEERAAFRRARVVLETLSWIGTPYRHQASQKGQGTDCLGLVRGVLRSLSGREPEAVPPYPPRLLKDGEPLLEAAERHLRREEAAAPGDIVLFRMRRSLPVGHCGILIARGRFVHAYEGQSVLSTALGEFWASRIAGIYSFPEEL